MYCTIEGKTTNVIRNEKLERINSYLNAVLNSMDKRKEFIKNGQIVDVNEHILSKLKAKRSKERPGTTQQQIPSPAVTEIEGGKDE